MFNLKLILKFFLNPFSDMAEGHFPFPQFGLNSQVKLWRHTETVPGGVGWVGGGGGLH